MIALAMALHLAASQPERCDTVRRDHDQFKAWAQSSLAQFNSSPNGPLSKADRARRKAFETKVEAAIDELNRRYANCKED